MENWRDIKGYPNYMVSNLGRVKSLGNNKTRKEKILKLHSDKDGYLEVQLCKEGKHKKYLTHRLVALAFIPNPNNYPIINHKDENKSNNRVDNLEWCTSQYNNIYGTRIEKVAKVKYIPILQFSLEGELVRKWDGAMQVEKDLGFSHQAVGKCCKGKLKSAFGYKWRYYYKGIWLKKHIPQIKLKKVA